MSPVRVENLAETDPREKELHDLWEAWLAEKDPVKGREIANRYRSLSEKVAQDLSKLGAQKSRSVRRRAKVASGSSTNRPKTGEKGRATMAGRTITRSGGKSAAKGSTAKAGAKTAAEKKAAAAAKGNGSAANRRSGVIEKVRKDASKIAKRLREGTKMKEIKADYSLSDDGPVRVAMINDPKGPFDSKGKKITVETINAGNATGRKKVTKLRGEGTPWYVLAFATGLTEAALKEIVEKEGGATGRVYRKSETAAKAPGGKSRGR